MLSSIEPDISKLPLYNDIVYKRDSPKEIKGEMVKKKDRRNRGSWNKKPDRKECNFFMLTLPQNAALKKSTFHCYGWE